MRFGEVIAQVMKEKGLSQSEVARRMGTGRSTVNMVINNPRRGPNLETAIRIANAMDVSLQYLVDMMGEDEPEFEAEEVDEEWQEEEEA